MSLNKKFIYYCRVSVSEGLSTELSTSQLMLENYDKKVYQKCRYCHCVIEIEKAFKEEEDTCNMCLKLLKNQDRINPQIYIIWTDNQEYRVFTNFHCSFADRIFRYENIKYKFGEIPQEVIDNHCLMHVTKIMLKIMLVTPQCKISREHLDRITLALPN